MFQEDLAYLTSNHLREHIKVYLAAVDARYSGNKKVPLVVPKTIEVASVVGGMMKDFDKILPAYGIDVVNIVAAEDASSLWSYEYLGQINGLVSASSQSLVDAMIKRHANAVERFVREHLFLHQPTNDYFKIVNFVAGNLEFSGAEELGEVEGKETWLGAFSLNVSWFTSEDGPSDHGSG